jgi:hypothetical protein
MTKGEAYLAFFLLFKLDVGAPGSYASTHHMHDPGSIVPHIQPKGFTNNQMSRINYDYYINSVSKDCDDSQWNGTAEDTITPHE